VLPTLVTDRALNITVEPANGPEYRQSVRVNSQVALSIPDMVTMDGVIHGIDTILVPPAIDSNNEGEQVDDDSSRTRNRSWLSRVADWFSGASAEETLTVDQWIERLQPLVGKIQY